MGRGGAPGRPPPLRRMLGRHARVPRDRGETARALLWVDAHVAAAALFPRDAAQLTVLRGGRRAVPAVACPWIGRAPCRPRAKTARITRRS